MIKFRRTIAIFILALFTCQAVMAGIGEHLAFQSDGSTIDAQHLASVSHMADNNTDHGQPGAPDLVDGDCCHAQGHCHVLALAGPVANLAIPCGLIITSSHTFSHHSQYFDPLLRPPISA